ncbi:MAG: polysaccharide deacetylase family protein [Chitinophagales bacterium]|nr:polysaccharide deacetylase family protein [Chitinophagales bacterium]
MFLPYIPKLIQHAFPQLLWRVENSNSLYLTFDDGPVPEVTPWVLDQLKQRDIKASFFCIGDNVQRHPDIFQALRDQGHQVGNHTQHHVSGWATDDEQYLDEVMACQQWVASKLFRPPYGRIGLSQINLLKPDYSIVMWNVLSGDYDPNLSAEQCFQNATRYARPGSIIVFHDSIKAFPRLKEALPRALDYWQQKGFQFDVLT